MLELAKERYDKTTAKSFARRASRFCAGVDRAIKIVELAIEKHGDPVYVRHEIVHNRFVVQRLEEKGAIFVDELNEVPEDAPVVFSAHGVPKSVFAEAKKRDLYYLMRHVRLLQKFTWIQRDIGSKEKI